ncbi:MAG: ABC transporter ATP-binding protein [Shinella sp.]|nr:ABC transporter ATP-binding protein [Shinella sp.]
MLDVKDLRAGYGSTEVLQGVTLSVRKGEVVSILGRNGVGKTTLMKALIGLNRPTAGQVVLGGKAVAGLAPERIARSGLAYVPQGRGIFHKLSVLENLTMGTRARRDGGTAIPAEIFEMFPILAERRSQLGGTLSGGQQQQLALGRALAPRPQVLLLDEPLSALNAKIRISLREEIRRIQQELGITTIFVTHDQEEALSISDRIVVMHQGIADQVGTPFDIYNRPATRFVAEFVGTLNLVDADVLEAANGRVRLGEVPVALNRPLPTRAGERISLALRPETVALGRAEGHDVVLSGRIAEVHFLGSVIRIRVMVGEQGLSLDTSNQPDRPPPAVGASVEVSISDRDLLVLAA